jgi:conjugal transfer mating pair stabilization protein TraG
VQAIMVQTGWSRNLSRSATDQNTMGSEVSGSISASLSASPVPRPTGALGSKRVSSGGITGNIGFQSSDQGITSETADASLDILNYDVHSAVAAAERRAARSSSPETAFTKELSKQILGSEGLRNRYLQHASSARGTADLTGPLTSLEQASVLRSGRFSSDLAEGAGDGDASFIKR